MSNSDMEALKSIRSEHKTLPESYGHDLRLNLAEIVVRRLDEKGWTQKMLAEKSGTKELFISRIINSDQDCTFDVAGRVLFALGVKAKLVDEKSIEQSAGRR